MKKESNAKVYLPLEQYLKDKTLGSQFRSTKIAQ